MENIQDLRYLPLPNDNDDIIFSMCSFCGGLVGDMRYHERWHKELDGLVERTMQAVRGYVR
jgi:hypothetical protein